MVMAQRALTEDSQTALAVGLLERAARVSGSPGFVASIGFPARTPTWEGSLGQHGSGSYPIVAQKGLYKSTLDAPLSLLLDSRPQRRILSTLRDRGLVAWGDMTRHAVGRPRQWLPAHIIAQMVTFPADPPGGCPHDEHRHRDGGTLSHCAAPRGSHLPYRPPTIDRHRTTHLAIHHLALHILTQDFADRHSRVIVSLPQPF